MANSRPQSAHNSRAAVFFFLFENFGEKKTYRRYRKSAGEQTHGRSNPGPGHHKNDVDIHISPVRLTSGDGRCAAGTHQISISAAPPLAIRENCGQLQEKRRLSTPRRLPRVAAVPSRAAANRASGKTKPRQGRKAYRAEAAKWTVLACCCRRPGGVTLWHRRGSIALRRPRS